jgi:predicted metal-dependent hydrolase
MTTAVSTTPFDIPVRRDLGFDFQSTPAHHCTGNPLTSHLWNALSLLAPHTEAFLIRAMKQARESVTDPDLRAQVDAFLSQEALHTRHHTQLNARLGELGYDVDSAGKVIASVLRELTDKNSPRSALALVIAGEYVIYAISRAVLEEPRLLEGSSSEVRRLLEWHALEEMEHQSVACDVYRHLYGEGPKHRFLHVRALLRACRVLATALRRAEAQLLRSDRAPQPRDRRAHALYMFWSPGLVWKVLGKLPRFLAPGFQHWQDPIDRELIAEAEARVYGSS